MFANLFSLLTCLSSLATLSTASLHGPVSRRIVRGFEVDIKSFPYAVFLYFNKRTPSSCGASLITVQAVVTSAHCMQELAYNKDVVHAFLGASIPMYSKVVRNITKFKIHPHYDPTRGKFDLSVAKFSHEVIISHSIRKIPIYRHSIKINDNMYTVGWGKKWPNVMPDFSDARSLVASKQRMVPVSECLNTSGIRNSPAFLCSFPVHGFHYRGDLGNGLVALKPFLALAGVVSFLVQDATLYASVLNERAWLRQALKTIYGKNPVDDDCC